MENRELGVAIVGTGFAGRAHAHAARAAGARLIGVAGSTPERGEEASRAHGAVRSFASVEDAVECDDVDVVHICLPNSLHVPTALRALAAGKHVVCEKPLAVDLAEADQLVAAWRTSGLVGSVPFAYRYYPMVRELRSRIAAGELGRLHLVHGSYLQDWMASVDQSNWRVEEGLGGRSRAFADIGSHWCDLVEFITGQRIVELSARTGRVFTHRPNPVGRPTFAAGSGEISFPVPNEDVATLQFLTDHGAMGSAVISQVSPGRKNRLLLEISGATGSAAFDQEHPDTAWIGRRESATLLSSEPDTLCADAARLTNLPAGHPHGWLNCMEGLVADTYQAVLGASTPEGLPTFDDGRRAAALTEAVLESAANDGRWMMIDKGVDL